jgi:hypothetical protein
MATRTKSANHTPEPSGHSVQVLEKTSADLGWGPFYGGIPTVRGWLWAGGIDGVRSIAFNTDENNSLVVVDRTEIRAVRKVMGVPLLNTVVDVDYIVADIPLTICFAAPTGRLKKVFAFLDIKY